MYYSLLDKKPIKCTREHWAKHTQDESWIIKQTNISDDIKVSTVFLGVDHNWMPSVEEGPILFETMVFGGCCDGLIKRCCTWADALKDHDKAIEFIENEHA